MKPGNRTRSLIQNRNKRRKRSSYRLSDGHEPVAHPSPRRPVPADVGESALKVAIGGAEGDLLDGLVDDEALGLVVDDAEAVPVHVEDGADELALRLLEDE